MTDLAPAAGLTASVDDATGELRLGDDVVAEEWAWRSLEDARDVYSDAPATAPPLYHMANGITPAGAEEPQSELRLELTSLRPGEVGNEWVKTIGHIHDTADTLGYPETYEVVAGHGVFVLFRPELGTCALVSAEAGERFVIPPGWHHLAVNPGGRAMVFLDAVGRAVRPDYTLLRSSSGAPYRLGQAGIAANHAHPLYELRQLRAADLPPPVAHGRLADVFLASRKTLDYLLHPSQYDWSSSALPIG
jgi:glucose-6-phosphate isomerase, archaeal